MVEFAYLQLEVGQERQIANTLRDLASDLLLCRNKAKGSSSSPLALACSKTSLPYSFFFRKSGSTLSCRYTVFLSGAVFLCLTILDIFNKFTTSPDCSAILLKVSISFSTEAR